MKTLLADGLRPAQAAIAILAALPAPAPLQRSAAVKDEPLEADGTTPIQQVGAQFAAALEAFDAPAAELAFDRLLAGWTTETVLRDIVVPYLGQLGERWQNHDVTVSQEHFASNLLRTRLSGLSRGWGQGHGPIAVLACPPGELHDLPLMIFGVALSNQGWRIRYLGQDIPLADLGDASRAIRPALIVLAATVPDHFTKNVHALTELAGTFPLAIAGNGSSPRIAEAIGAKHLALDPVTAAHQV